MTPSKPTFDRLSFRRIPRGFPLAFALLISATGLGAAELKLAGMFTDHMVLQRDQPVAVWGTSDPGDEVAVAFAGQRKSTKAATDGAWLIKLDPLPASGEGRELIVRSTKGGRESKLTDVVVGDVWLCSGQSNMHFRMKSTADSTSEIAAARQPGVRYFTVEHQFGLQPASDVQGKWLPISPETASECSAVACYFGMDLQRKIGVPVGLVVSSVGGTRIETWMRPSTLAATGQGTSLIEKWKAIPPDEFARIGAIYSEFQRQRDEVYPEAVKAAKAKGETPPPAPVAPKLRCHDCPSALHHGMIAPLERSSFRGVIWYQGESNAGQADAYEKLLPAMIADWRKLWGSKLPFLFVQLAPHPSNHPAFREAQARIWRNTPDTAMVVTTDVGDATNIHPTRKRPVGERLALAARQLAYGETVEFSGPVAQIVKIDGNQARISFSHLGGGLISKDGPLKGFTMAGPDGVFMPAQAVIEGDDIVVTAEKVSQPVTVRFGWAAVPDVNLFNREQLPAVPFTLGQAKGSDR